MSALKNLKSLLKKLRQDEGCAWTREQTFESLAPQTLEECYELVEAIEQQDIAAIRDELGDMLYHLFFYAQLAEEHQLFTLDDVAEVTLQKHRERMPTAEQLTAFDASQVNDYWQQIKIKNANNSAQTVF